jgi:cytidylate kinase
LSAGKDVLLETVLSQQQARDASDENRSVGPLKPADDAIIIDTTVLTVEQVVGRIEQVVKEKTRG